jgi:hypothetical protein
MQLTPQPSVLLRYYLKQTYVRRENGCITSGEVEYRSEPFQTKESQVTSYENMATRIAEIVALILIV